MYYLHLISVDIYVAVELLAAVIPVLMSEWLIKKIITLFNRS